MMQCSKETTHVYIIDSTQLTVDHLGNVRLSVNGKQLLMNTDQLDAVDALISTALQDMADTP